MWTKYRIRFHLSYFSFNEIDEEDEDEEKNEKKEIGGGLFIKYL